MRRANKKNVVETMVDDILKTTSMEDEFGNQLDLFCKNFRSASREFKTISKKLSLMKTTLMDDYPNGR